MPQGKQQYFTAGGIPLVGGKVYTYAAGTTTPLATYTTAAASTPNANPVILDSRGEASIFFSAANYKIVVKDSLDSTIWTQDNLPGDAAATVVANLVASTGSSLIGHIASGTGSVATTVQAKLQQWKSVFDWFTPTQIADVIAKTALVDVTTACQTAINYCRDVGWTLIWPDGYYRTTSTLNTQYDANYKAINWEFFGGVIVADFSGSVALNITGGALPQRIRNITIQPSTTYAMTGANYDTASHGVTITNTVVDITGLIQNFRGYGVNAVTSAANSNTSNFDLTIQTCNFGFYASGTNDNFSVVTAKLKIYNCASSAFYCAASCPIRQWVVWLYAEANCTAVTAVASVYVESATKGVWWIYSEQQNAANEIDFSSTNNLGNRIDSARFNKDTYANGNMVYYGGDLRKSYVQTWTPTLAGSSTAGTQTYSVQKGYWTQEGNKITVWGYLTMTAKDGATAGNLRIYGLPVTPANTGMQYPAQLGEIDKLTLTAGKLGVSLQGSAGNTYLSFIEYVSAGNASFTPVANLANDTTVVFTCTYLV